MYDRHQTPPPTTIEQVRPWVSLWLRLQTPFVLLYVGLTAIQGFSTPTSTVAVTTPPPSMMPASSSSPVVIQFPEELVIVTHTPEATPEPTPTYAVLPTPRPPDVCIKETPRGAICTMPEPPPPTPTPIPPCPVRPKEQCVSQGREVTWITPTLGLPITNDLVGEANAYDSTKVADDARSYRP